MLLVLILVALIAFIVLSTTRLKLHPFLALLAAAFIAGFAYQLPSAEIVKTITGGFGSILGYIGMRHADRHKKASLVFDLVPSREQDTALDDNYAFAEDDGFTDGIDENGQPK